MKRKRRDSTKRPRTAHSHNDHTRQDWRPILISIGLRESEIDNPDGIRPEAISEAGERAGLPLEMIAEIIVTYAPTKDAGRETTTLTREARVELLARRCAAGVDLYSGGDVVRGILDDLDHAAEGKQRAAEGESDRARRATFTDHEIEIERQEAEEAEDLSRFDVIPRRMMLEARERYRRRKESEGEEARLNDRDETETNGPAAILEIVAA